MVAWVSAMANAATSARTRSSRLVGADLLPCETSHLNGTTDVIAFARPHEMDIVADPDVKSGVPARVDRVLNLGAFARIELTAVNLKDQHGAPQRLDAEVTQRELATLHLDQGQTVRLVSRNLKVFPAPAAPKVDPGP